MTFFIKVADDLKTCDHIFTFFLSSVLNQCFSALYICGSFPTLFNSCDHCPINWPPLESYCDPH